MFNYISAFCLAVIYTFIEDLNDILCKKNKLVLNVIGILIALLGMISMDHPGIRIMIMMVYVKFYSALNKI